MNYSIIQNLIIKYPEKPDTELAKIYKEIYKDDEKIDTVRRKINFLREYYKNSKQTSPESLVLIMSDAHYGRVTENYKGKRDFCIDKAQERINNIKKGVLKIYKLLFNTYNFDSLYIIMLGDMIDGELTYPAQQMHVEIPELEQVIVATNDMINFIDDIKDYFPKVYLRGVYGNHAGDKRKHEVNKGDVYLYKFLEQKYANDNKIDVKFSEQFYDIITIKKFNFLLYHGTGIKSYLNLPFYGIQRWGLNRLATLQEKWDYLLLGHFHNIAYLPGNGFDVYMNGTLLTNDPYSIEKFGTDGMNCWWLLSVHKERGVTFTYKLNVLG